jgi:hypothetical protein
LIIIFFYLGQAYGWNDFTLSATAIAIFGVIAGFMYSFVRIEKRDVSRSKRRVGVLVNYAALLLLLACFYAAEGYGLNMAIAAAGIILFVVIVVSFISVQIRTHLWHLVHAKTKDLDERQIQVTHESLMRSYGAFSVICLSILLIAELIREYSGSQIDTTMMPVIGALIYLAHTLPSSILAWTEKEV